MMKLILRWLAWPFLLIGCLAIFAYGMAVDLPIICFNLAYVYLAVSLFFLERYIPHERAWLGNDG